MPEKDPIQSNELAEQMAYAQIPFRDMADRARQLGRPEAYADGYIHDAEAASNAAGREYLARLSLNLSQYENESLPEVAPQIIVRATKNDMVAFVADHEDPKAAKTLMSRLWSAFEVQLRRSRHDYRRHFIFGPQLNHPNLTELKQILLTQTVIDDSMNVRNIGDKQKDLLQMYYDARLVEQTVEEPAESI